MKAPFRIAVINDEITQGLPVPTKWRPTNLAEAGSKCGLWNKNIFKPEMAAGIDQVLWNNGGQGRNRTADASLFRAALYRLSYLAILTRWTGMMRSEGSLCCWKSNACRTW